jgi:hypothetical protein
MVEKFIKDKKVAVIYHPNYGVGWFTDLCYGIQELLFEPKIVNIILNPNFQANKKNNKFDLDLDKQVDDIIEEINERNYIIKGNNGDYKMNLSKEFGKKIIYSLDIYWVPINHKFFITNYDGEETVHVEDKIKWINA